jgi:hypothetical protein
VPARAYRAALVAAQMAELHDALGRSGNSEAQSWLVAEDVARALLLRALELSPHHRPAWLLRVEIDLAHIQRLQMDGHGRDAEAVLAQLRDDLSRQIAGLSAAPGLRFALARVLLLDRRTGEARRLIEEEIALHQIPPVEVQRFQGEIALRCGTDPETFGMYLDEEPISIDAPELDAARVDVARGDNDAALERLLVYLGSHPTNPDALYALSQVGFNPKTKSPKARDVANRAVARSRLLMAARADRTGEDEECRLHLRFALAKDEELLDAWLLKARLEARTGHGREAVDALFSIRKGLVSGVELRLRLERDPAFREMLNAGELESALRDA